MTEQKETGASLKDYLAEYDVRGAGVWADTPEEAAEDIERLFIAPIRSALMQAYGDVERLRVARDQLRTRIDAVKTVSWQALRGVSQDSPDVTLRMILSILDGTHGDTPGGAS